MRQTGFEHDPEKWKPVSRLREARFGGRSKVRKDHAPPKKLERQSLQSEAIAL
jgi:hypothetical protein